MTTPDKPSTTCCASETPRDCVHGFSICEGHTTHHGGGGREMRTDADWKGPLVLRFRWQYLHHEWGRWCYRTNALGETLDSWFEWEHE